MACVLFSVDRKTGKTGGTKNIKEYIVHFA